MPGHTDRVARACAAFLTGCQPRKTHGANLQVGISADQLAAAGVRCNSVHPGWVDTPGLAGAKDMEGFYRMMGGALRDDDEGADTIVWLAACPGLRETGKYFFDRSARKKHKVSLFSTSASTSI